MTNNPLKTLVEKSLRPWETKGTIVEVKKVSINTGSGNPIFVFSFKKPIGFTDAVRIRWLKSIDKLLTNVPGTSYSTTTSEEGLKYGYIRVIFTPVGVPTAKNVLSPH